jgi:hypothetical protein
MGNKHRNNPMKNKTEKEKFIKKLHPTADRKGLYWKIYRVVESSGERKETYWADAPYSFLKNY